MAETVGTYEVDSAMLGDRCSLRLFCRILQTLTEIEIVCITDSHNGARCSTQEVEELIEAPWALALELLALELSALTDEITAEITAEEG